MTRREETGCFRSNLGYKSALWVCSLIMIIAVLGCGGDDGSPPNTDPDTVSFSGTISAPDGVTIDGDVNDPNETYFANDTLQTAQEVTNPVSIGGYVNVAGSGESGRSFASGDTDDCFSVTFSAGDIISLAIGDPFTGDLDLYLYDDGGNYIDDSSGTDRYETITVPADGTYIVNVYAYDGASNYILAIGTDVSDAGDKHADILSTRYDFVPGQAIVRFKETGQLSKASGVDRITAMGMALAAGAVDREMLVTFDEQDLQSEAYQTLGVSKYLSSEKVGDDPATIRKLRTLHVIKAMRKRADVLSADPNYIVQPMATAPNDELYSRQWHYPQINLPQAWDITTGSSDVVVAVVDTGVLMNHPDLKEQLTSTGYDFIKDNSMSNDGGGIDADPDDPGDSATAGSSSFHGTHCAGTIAASTNNGIGVAGVSWDAKIMPVRVLGVGGGTTYDVLQGVRYAAGLENDSGIKLSEDQRADIISMSLGGGGYTSTEASVYAAVRDQGIIVIAAAGNESTATPSYPASYDGVVSVSAVNINGTLASYSNYGNYVDVAAPGGDAGDYDGDGYSDRVWSTCGDDSSGSIQYNYTAYNGTSMATPHVAGVVALMKALAPDMTPGEFDALLQNGDITNDIGDTGRDNYYGYGLIDAYQAVVAVSSGVPTSLIVSPTTVNFGTGSTSATITVSKVGSDAISVTDYSAAPETWLTLSGTDVDADGLGTYTATADRSGLSDGNYSSTFTFTPSSGDPITVPVNLQVSSTSTSADAGFHYVLLVDPETYESLTQDDVQAVGGSYSYSFNNVTKGQSYLIIAGSDRDNDLYIGNAGESLGAYLTLDQITAIDANSDLTGLDFTTDLKLSVSASDLADGDSDGTALRFRRLE